MMEKLAEIFYSFNEISVVARLVLAVICGGIIGLEREKKRRAAGFRTHILISMGAAMTALVGQYLMTFSSTDPLRIGAQVVSGMGFIGAGAIIVTRRKEAKGLTTAAGLWTTAIIGLAAGAVLSAAMMPRKKSMKCTGGRMARAIGDIIDNVAGIIG